MFALGVCILGYIYIALLVIAITNLLVFTSAEQQSHLLLRRLQLNDKVNKLAEKVVLQFIRYWIYKKMERTPLEINMAFSLARSYLWKF